MGSLISEGGPILMKVAPSYWGAPIKGGGAFYRDTGTAKDGKLDSAWWTRLVILNFGYELSCVHVPHWSLPLLVNKPEVLDFVHQTVSHREAHAGWARDLDLRTHKWPGYKANFEVFCLCVAELAAGFKCACNWILCPHSSQSASILSSQHKSIIQVPSHIYSINASGGTWLLLDSSGLLMRACWSWKSSRLWNWRQFCIPR